MGADGGDGGAEEMTIGTDGFFQVGMLPTKTVAGRIVVENIVVANTKCRYGIIGSVEADHCCCSFAGILFWPHYFDLRRNRADTAKFHKMNNDLLPGNLHRKARAIQGFWIDGSVRNDPRRRRDWLWPSAL